MSNPLFLPQLKYHKDYLSLFKKIFCKNKAEAVSGWRNLVVQ